MSFLFLFSLDDKRSRTSWNCQLKRVHIEFRRYVTYYVRKPTGIRIPNFCPINLLFNKYLANQRNLSKSWHTVIPYNESNSPKVDRLNSVLF
ncbi:Uncharacterised protein r2_g525 [Pycnogonum litorale]